MIDIETFTSEARQWLDENAKLRTTNNDGKRELIWGQGEFSVAVFHNLSFEEEKGDNHGCYEMDPKKSRSWIPQNNMGA